MAKHPVLQPSPTLPDIQKYVSQTNLYRGHNTTAEHCLLLLCEEVGELAKAVRKATGGRMDPDSKDSHVDEEAADVLWVLTSLCNTLGINLEQALRAKDEKNKRRSWRSA